MDKVSRILYNAYTFIILQHGAVRYITYKQLRRHADKRGHKAVDIS